MGAAGEPNPSYFQAVHRAFEALDKIKEDKMYSTLPSFDELKKLAQENPEELERFRQQQVNAIIESAPEHLRRRLKGIQFQVDCRRKLHKSAMGSCISISKMMQDSVKQLNEVLNGTGKAAPKATKQARQNGQVLSFPVTAN